MRDVHQQRIDAFMRLAGQETPLTPTIPLLAVRQLRANLILEEAIETIKGLGFNVEATSRGGKLECLEAFVPDIVEVVDGCADVSVVTIGTLSAFGVSATPILEVVDGANLDKFGPGSYRRADGKWIKPPDFKPADILALLRAQGYAA